jgi:predicted dienelactone hydrolase
VFLRERLHERPKRISDVPSGSAPVMKSIVSCVVAATVLSGVGIASRAIDQATGPRAGGYKLGPGPRTPAAVPLLLHDGARQKDLEVMVRYPTGRSSPEERFPLVIFSHGAGGSREAFADLTAHWASHGYVVILPTHGDSIELRRRHGEDVSRLRQNLDSLRTDVRPMDRLADVVFLLDSLDVVEKQVPALRSGDGKGRIDRERVAVAGHSAGALTTQMAFGVKVRTLEPGGLQPRSHGDARVRAAILVSGQGTSNRMFTPDSWSELSKPMLVVTGSKDVAAIGNETPASRREPFDRAKPGDKYLLFIEGATHSSYQGRGAGLLLDREVPDRATLEMITSVTASVTLAFLDAYIKDDRAARAYLASDAVKTLSSNNATLERR